MMKEWGEEVEVHMKLQKGRKALFHFNITLHVPRCGGSYHLPRPKQAT